VSATTATTDEQRAGRTADYDGTPVAYTEFGDPDGEPVVFFHGTPGSRLLAGLYDDPAQTRGVRVLSFDRPGYGETPPVAEYDQTDSPELLAAVLDDAGVESADLVAFSGGAPHALAAAAANADRVGDVDVVSGGVPASVREETPTPQRVLGSLAEHAPRLLGGLLRGQAWAARRLPASFVVAQYTTDGGEDLPEAVRELVKRDFLKALAAHRAGVVRESRQFTGDWTFPLSAVDAEVRWWHGEDDANVPVDGARRVANRLPDCECSVLAGVDHLGALVESRERVLDRYAPDT